MGSNQDPIKVNEKPDSSFEKWTVNVKKNVKNSFKLETTHCKLKRIIQILKTKIVNLKNIL